MTNEQVVALLKAQITTALGGQVTTQQFDEFIDMAVDQTAILQIIRIETAIKVALELDTIELGDPAMVRRTQGSAPDSADVIAPTITPRTLTMRDAAVYFDVTFEMIRRNIAGGNLNTALNGLFSKRFGKDIVRTLFNGDRDKANDTRLNKCLRVADGIIKLATADGNVHDYTVVGQDYLGTIFPGMLKLMPKDYRDDRESLGLFVSADVEDEYSNQIGARQTAYGDQVMFGTGEKFYRYKRITIFPVFGLPDNNPLLSPKKNFVAGFGEEMTVGHDIYTRKRVDEVTITTDLDFNYALGDAIVMGAA